MSKNATVDEYIRSFPEDVQKMLEQVRKTVHKAVPGAEERISYGIPALRAGGRNVVFFSGWKDHIAIYPRPQHPAEDLEARLESHVTGKGTIRFDLDRPIPYDLIREVAEALRNERSQN